MKMPNPASANQAGQGRSLNASKDVMRTTCHANAADAPSRTPTCSDFRNKAVPTVLSDRAEFLFRQKRAHVHQQPVICLEERPRRYEALECTRVLRTRL